MSTTKPPKMSEPSKSKRSAAGSWRRILVRVVAVLVVVVAAAAGTIYAVTESRMSKTYDIDPVPMAVAASPSLAEKGRAVATFRGCRDCHGSDLAGRVVGDSMPVMKLAAPNITAGGVTRDYSDEDWARSIRHGVRPDGTPIRFMPSYEWTQLSHEDLAALVAYARSVPAVDEPAEPFEVGPLGRVLYLAGELPLIAAEMVDHSAKPTAPTPGPTAEYGRYLSTSCTACHGEKLSGGPIPGVPPEWPEAANLTAHATGLKDWTLTDFQTAMRTGKRPDGTELRGEYMPWQVMAQSSDEDLEALWKYIRSVEPRPAGNR